MSFHATFVTEPIWCKDCFAFLQAAFMEGRFAADFSTVVVGDKRALAGKYKSSNFYDLEEGDLTVALGDASEKRDLCHIVRIGIMPEGGPAHSIVLEPTRKDSIFTYVEKGGQERSV